MTLFYIEVLERITKTESIMEAWVKIYNTWKGGRRWTLSVKVTLFEYNPITGFYRCSGYRPYSGMNTSPKRIEHISKSNIIKKLK